jgi:hypothetical protein
MSTATATSGASSPVASRSRSTQGHLAPRTVRMNLDGLAPNLALAGVDLAEVKHLSLRHPAIGKAAVLHDVPVLVSLAVLHPSAAAQEHAPHSM